MFTWFASLQAKVCSSTAAKKLATFAGLFTLSSLPSWAQEAGGGEAALRLPDLSTVKFLAGIDGHTLLLIGLLFCVLGLLFGLAIYMKLKNLLVHPSMLEISELIYETCKTYLTTQGKFILLLELFIGVIMVFYFGVLQHLAPFRVAVILLFSLIGIAGSYG